MLLVACRSTAPAKQPAVAPSTEVVTAPAAALPLSDECRTYDAAVDRLLACPELPSSDYVEQARRRKSILTEGERDARQTRSCVGATRAAREVSDRYGCQ